VSGLNQAGKFSGRNQGHVTRASASHNDRFLLIHDVIQNAGQVLSQACVRGLGCHDPIVQDSCTPRAAVLRCGLMLGMAFLLAATTFLPTGLRLDPVGDAVDLGSLPLAMALAPGGERPRSF